MELRDFDLTDYVSETPYSCNTKPGEIDIAENKANKLIYLKSYYHYYLKSFMPLPNGTWKANVDGSVSDLIISSPNEKGIFTGSFAGVDIKGFWDEFLYVCD